MTFTGELRMLVQRRMSLGTYHSERELLLEAVKLLDERDKRIAQLRVDLQPAIDRLDRGEGRPLDVEQIKMEGRQMLVAQGGGPS